MRNITWILLFIVSHLLPPLLDGKIYCFPRNIRTAAYTTPIASLSCTDDHTNKTNEKTFTCSAKLAKYNELRCSDLCSKNYQIVKVQRSKYWGQPLLLLTAGEIEPTLSSEKFERQTNFPAIKSSTAGKRSLLFKILHQQRDPEPKYPILFFVHIVKKYSIKRYTELSSLSRQYIKLMIDNWFYLDTRKSRRCHNWPFRCLDMCLWYTFLSYIQIE